MNKCKNCGTEFESAFCPNCGTKAENVENAQPQKQTTSNEETSKKNKQQTKRILFWASIIIIIVLFVTIGLKLSNKLESENNNNKKDEKSISEKVEIADDENSYDSIKNNYEEASETTEITNKNEKKIVKPIVYSGSGDKVISDISVPQRIYKVTMTNSGSSNFIIHAYTSNGDRLSSLANEIGNYKGSIVLTDNIDGGILEVVSNGSWKITFEEIPDGGTSNISGSGDWVSPWFNLDSGALIVSLSNEGKSNFIVHIFDENGERYSSLSNEIGNYEGNTVFNQGQKNTKYCIEVISDGTWKVDFGLGDKLTKK